jgi:hypothetical protein
LPAVVSKPQKASKLVAEEPMPSRRSRGSHSLLIRLIRKEGRKELGQLAQDVKEVVKRGPISAEVHTQLTVDVGEGSRIH